MSDIYLRRTLNALVPDDEAALIALRHVKQGEVVRCEVTKPRNVQFHRMFFAMLNTVWLNCGDWKDVDELLRALKYKIGHYDSHPVVDHKTGEVIAEVIELRSISFAAMDQIEFNAFFNRCIDVICTELVPGIKDSVLRDEVMRAVGLPMPEQRQA